MLKSGAHITARVLIESNDSEDRLICQTHDKFARKYIAENCIVHVIIQRNVTKSVYKTVFRCAI